MNLLLLLSALLTACTGAFADGRHAVAPQSVTRRVAAVRATDVVSPAKVRRPVAGLVRLVSLAQASIPIVAVVVAAEPIYAARRRE